MHDRSNDIKWPEDTNQTGNGDEGVFYLMWCVHEGEQKHSVEKKKYVWL